jgi:hypothetical protein
MEWDKDGQRGRVDLSWAESMDVLSTDKGEIKTV